MRKILLKIAIKTLDNAEGAPVINENIEENIKRIKQQPGKDIWLFGGAVLTKTLMTYRLIDELHLSVHPLLLGSGKLLFINGDDRTQVTLIDNKSYSTGLVQ